MAWIIDGPELDQVICIFDLKLPVRIQKHQGGSQLLGTHQLKAATEAPTPVFSHYYHHITVGARLTPWRASRTIWHECAHAKQAEAEMSKSGQPFDSLRSAQAFWRMDEKPSLGRYVDYPHEVEARRYEDYAEFITPCV
jgi:hypothetical protein